MPNVFCSSQLTNCCIACLLRRSRLAEFSASLNPRHCWASSSHPRYNEAGLWMLFHMQMHLRDGPKLLCKKIIFPIGCSTRYRWPLVTTYQEIDWIVHRFREDLRCRWKLSNQSVAGPCMKGLNRQGWKALLGLQGIAHFVGEICDASILRLKAITWCGSRFAGNRPGRGYETLRLDSWGSSSQKRYI